MAQREQAQRARQVHLAQVRQALAVLVELHQVDLVDRELRPVHVPAGDLQLDRLVVPNREPSQRFSNELSRATNRKQMENVWPCLTSVDQRLRDMDKMGMDVQAISPSPFHFMYWLEPEIAKKMSRSVNEHLASIVRAHPDRFVALAHVPLQAPEAAAEELDYCVRQLGFRGAEIGTNVVGTEISRGRDEFWRKAHELDVVVFMHPNGFTGGERLADHYFTNVIGNPLDTTVAVAHLVFDGVLERFPKLKLVAAQTFSTGVLALTYEPAGA